MRFRPLIVAVIVITSAARAAEPDVGSRAAAIVTRMTPDEKASQLVNASAAIPRLGISGYNWWSEALHGAGAVIFPPLPVTVFPEPIGLAASFDPAMVREVATTIGDQQLALRARRDPASDATRQLGWGVSLWAPNLNIFRDPRWGRGQETYGEDPFLTGRMGVAFVQGIQGDPAHPRLIATPKHFAVHSGPERTRHTANVIVSRHDMIDTYLPAFRAAVVEGGARSIMCAYNRINGQPACANDFLLKTMLRGEWGFNGVVVSDCGAVDDVWKGHKFAATAAVAGAAVVEAGMDNSCAGYTSPEDARRGTVAFADAMRQGLLPSVDVDRALVRLVSERLRTGALADTPKAKTPLAADTPVDRALARRAAEESIVLLKNNGVLPLKPTGRVAVIGPLADNQLVLFGNYATDSARMVPALDGIQTAFPNATVSYAQGDPFLASQPVPHESLFTPDGQSGVRAEYFPTRDASRPTRTVTYLRLYADWPLYEPTAHVRFSGFIVAPRDGNYVLALRNGALALPGGDQRLTFDGRPLIARADNSTAYEVASLPMHLVAGERHAFVLDTDVPPGTPGNIKVTSRLVWRRAEPLPYALEIARAADTVVAVIGLTSELEGEESTTITGVPGFANGDRLNMELPAPEQALLEALKATGKPLVVVLLNGSALGVGWAKTNADAIVEAWYPGEEGGNAVGRVLAGAVNPAGRLPVTFYTGIKQLPPFADYSMAHRTYRYFTGTPLWPFGHGLSYTRFTYSGLRLASPRLRAGDPLDVRVKITNTGSRAGDEVVQLYLDLPAPPGNRARALRAFRRVSLAAGAAMTLDFHLDAYLLSSVDPSGLRRIAPGRYRLSVGGGQPNTGAPGVSTDLMIAAR